MMTKVLRRTCWFLLGATLSILAACGGGDGNDKSGTVVDPATSYTGSRAPARITSENARALALGAYGGGRIGTSLGSPRILGKVDAKAAADTASRPVLQITQVIKKSLLRMELPKHARERATENSVRLGKGMAKAGKTVARVENFEIAGEEGGTASYLLDINESNGTFDGTVVFDQFTEDGVTVYGTAELLGSFDANMQEFSRLTVTFKQLSVQLGSGSRYTLVGTLSWGADFAAASDTLSINVVLLTQGGGSYWFNNYELGTQYANGETIQTVKGRYYDYEHGYVDFTTGGELMVQQGYSWPSAGDISFVGNSGTWLRMVFETRRLLLHADVDGNGTPDWQDEMETNAGAVQNDPPVASAGDDLTVTQGNPVSLDGRASFDPEGVPLSYSWTFQSCPNGACPSITAANTSTPSFVPADVGTYILTVMVSDGAATAGDSVVVTSTAPQPSQPDLLQQRWQYGVMGTSIGRAGLLTTDIDDDGTPEIVASASTGTFGANSFWYVLRRGSDGGYHEIWRSEFHANPVVQLSLAELTGDGKEDLVVGLADGVVSIVDGRTLRPVRSINTENSLYSFAVADLEQDGAKEIVTSNGVGIKVYSAASGAEKWSISTAGGNSIAVGNVDDDAALEIVATGYGGKGYVTDGVTRTVSWEYLDGFGAKVLLGALDGDGRQKIVGASSWYKITVFDAQRKTPTYELTTSHDIGALLIADSDGDGAQEVIYGDGQWGKVHSVDPATRQEKWSVNNESSGISGIAVSDLDGDGKKELLFGAGGNSTGSDHLYIADPATGTVLWKSTHVDGPLSALDIGDVDDDGEEEVVMVSFESDSSYSEGVIHIFNARTHLLEYREKLGVADWMGVRSVRIGDVDGDGTTEFVVTTGEIYDGVLRVYDGKTRALKKESARYNGNYFSAIAIGDLDGDGKNEIVAGQGREHTGSTGSYLIVLDGATLQEKWRSVDLGSGWLSLYDIELADLDGDGHKDIAASVSGSRLVVYDGVNHDLKLLADLPARALEVADLDADGSLELLVGLNNGLVNVYDGKSLTSKRTVATFSGTPVNGLRVADLGAGTAEGLEWVIANDAGITVLGGEGEGLVWKSPVLSGSVALYNHIGLLDTDGDGRKGIFVGTRYALHHFE